MIDTKLIAAHQWVVDESQKKPGWWAEQAVMGATAMELVHSVLTWDSGWDAIVVLLVLIVAPLLVHAARTPHILKSLGQSTWVRGLFLGLVALDAFTLFATDQIGINVIDLLGTVLMLSYYCFAACDDPKPPKRKEKLVPTAA